MLERIHSIPKLLNAKGLGFNKTNLAKALSITRKTLYRYLDDEDSEFHVVLKRGGKYKFFANKSDKKV